MCHMPHVTCHMSYVTCHMSHVTPVPVTGHLTSLSCDRGGGQVYGLWNKFWEVS